MILFFSKNKSLSCPILDKMRTRMRFRILPKEDRKFRLRILNQVLLWGNNFRGEGSGNEDNFLNADCCAGPRFQAGKVPPLSPASLSFSGHQVLHSTTRQTGKRCIFDSSGNPPYGEEVASFLEQETDPVLVLPWMQ